MMDNSRLLVLGQSRCGRPKTVDTRCQACGNGRTAVAAKSKLILAFHIGRRSSADAHQLLHQVWQRLTPSVARINP